MNDPATLSHVPDTPRLRLALVSMHTSPADMPGAGDAGGMNVVERHQAEALGALGHQVELITRRSDPDLPELIELAPGVTLRHLDAGRPEPIAKSLQEKLVPAFSAELARLAPYDLVHSHHWMSGVAALPVARRWGIPHVQSFHSVAAPPGSPLADGERPESPGRIAGEALVAQESDLIVAISRYEGQVAVSRCHADPDRVVEVPPGVDGELFRPLRDGEPTALPGRSDPNGYVLFAARLQPLKGADLAVAALAEVPAAVRPTLIIAGEVSADFAAYRDELTTAIDQGGMTDQVVFLGPQTRPDLARLMRGARLVLVPSHSETFGLVALEAAASGVPVLASHAGGLDEVVVDGATGRLLERDPDAWAQAMTELLLDPEHAATIGHAARRRSSRFSWPAAGARLDELYAGLLAGRR